MQEQPNGIVLVVDDEEYVRDIVTRWLTAEGHRCVTAASADAAWDYLQKHEVHVVTLDVTMPGRSGVELLREITKADRDLQVIMLTALSQTETAIEALTNGACAYLIKPFMRVELAFHVRRAVERRDLLVAKRRQMFDLEEQVRQQTLVIRRTQEETIHRLISASEGRDAETGAHVRRVGLLSELLAAAAGWSHNDAEELRMAAPMHDVGKIGIPDAILRKPGSLTPSEFEVMKTHTTIGAKILSGSDAPMLRMTEKIALHHHERWDGTGYPHGLSGQAIPEVARIVGIVDVFDALTHDRVYRPAMSEEQALNIMQQGAGTHFDPLLLAMFFTRLDEIHRLMETNPDDDAAIVAPLVTAESEVDAAQPCAV